MRRRADGRTQGGGFIKRNCLGKNEGFDTRRCAGAKRAAHWERLRATRAANQSAGDCLAALLANVCVNAQAKIEFWTPPDEAPEHTEESCLTVSSNEEIRIGRASA